MRQCDLNQVIAGSITGRAEVMAAIAGLVEEVAHLALHVKRIVAIADARPGARPNTVEQAELKATSAATECDAQAVEMAEAANFPLSPQQDSCTGNASRGEIDLIYELKAKLEDALAEPKDAICREENPIAARIAEPKDPSCREENPIAARIAELHDRLGGFIKRSLPQPPDQNT